MGLRRLVISPEYNFVLGIFHFVYFCRYYGLDWTRLLLAVQGHNTTQL